MPADLDALLKGGGKGRTDLLQFAVYSCQPEPLFAFLAGELRLAPSVGRAVAMEDGFRLSGAVSAAAWC